GAEAVDAWLRDPRAAAPAMRRFGRSARHGIRDFSWFIFRMNGPGIRALFMRPSNRLRMREAVLRLLAGGLVRRPPIYGSLNAFKAISPVGSLTTLRASLAAWRHRRRAAQRISAEARA